MSGSGSRDTHPSPEQFSELLDRALQIVEINSRANPGAPLAPETPAPASAIRGRIPRLSIALRTAAQAAEVQVVLRQVAPSAPGGFF